LAEGERTKGSGPNGSRHYQNNVNLQRKSAFLYSAVNEFKAIKPNIFFMEKILIL
jgi:hypothetical protein